LFLIRLGWQWQGGEKIPPCRATYFMIGIPL
jgi:hypothetical protein